MSGHGLADPREAQREGLPLQAPALLPAPSRRGAGALGRRAVADVADHQVRKRWSRAKGLNTDNSTRIGGRKSETDSAMVISKFGARQLPAFALENKQQPVFSLRALPMCRLHASAAAAHGAEKLFPKLANFDRTCLPSRPSALTSLAWSLAKLYDPATVPFFDRLAAHAAPQLGAFKTA